MEHHPTAPVRVETLPGNIPNSVILKVNGPLTINNFFDFQQQARSLKERLLLIDLSGVPYMDSAALGAVVGIHVSRGISGRKYAIIGANERLRTTFGIAGLLDLLVSFPTVEQAEAALV